MDCFTCHFCKKPAKTGEELYILDDSRFICKEDFVNSRHHQSSGQFMSFVTPFLSLLLDFCAGYCFPSPGSRVYVLCVCLSPGVYFTSRSTTHNRQTETWMHVSLQLALFAFRPRLSSCPPSTSRQSLRGNGRQYASVSAPTPPSFPLVKECFYDYESLLLPLIVCSWSCVSSVV